MFADRVAAELAVDALLAIGFGSEHLGVAVRGVGGILALAGASTLWGGTVGAYLGAAVGERGWAAHEDLSYIALDPGEVFVVVCSHGRSDIVHDVVRRCGGRPVTIDRARLGVPD